MRTSRCSRTRKSSARTRSSGCVTMQPSSRRTQPRCSYTALRSELVLRCANPAVSGGSSGRCDRERGLLDSERRDHGVGRIVLARRQLVLEPLLVLGREVGQPTAGGDELILGRRILLVLLQVLLDCRGV